MSGFSLRPIRKGDEAMILAARNSDVVRPFMCSQRIITPQTHALWLDAKLANPKTEPYFIFSQGGAALGVVGITHFTPETHSGEWGFYIFAANAPKGSGTMMLAAFLEAVFVQKLLHKVTSLVMVHNVKSIGLHEKLGFMHKGLLTEYVSIDDRDIDVDIYSITAARWQEMRIKFQDIINTVTVSQE